MSIPAANADLPWPNVTLLERDGRKIYLVGTAHISERSVREVEAVIEAIRPDTVCVELCKTRYDVMLDADRWKRLEIFQILRQKKVLFLMANLVLSAYQRRLGEKLGVEPGGELLAAVSKAKEHGAELVLVDREIQATLKRTWARLGFVKRLQMTSALLGSFFSKEELTEDDLDKLKDRDTLTELMAAFAREVPEVKEPLIDERDHYLMSAIEDAPGQTIVAVVGAGHVPGMLTRFGVPADRERLSLIPPPSPWAGFAQWFVPALLVGLMALGVYKKGLTGETLEVMILAWALPTMIGCAIGTAAALAHPLTILAGGLCAPLTTLHPAIAAGMVTAPIEAWKRRPTVADCERVRDDADSLKGWYRNPFLRVLVVFTTSNLGAAIGAWIGLVGVARAGAGS